MLSIKCGQRSSICLQLGSWYEWTQNLKRMGKLLEGSCNAHTGQVGATSATDYVERRIVKGWYKFVGCKVGDRCLSSHRSSSVVASFIIPKGPCVSRTLVMSGLVLSYNLLSWNVLSYNVLSCFDQENFCHRDLWLCENSRLAQLCFL